MVTQPAPVWDSYLTDRDRQVAAMSGYGRRGGYGENPAVLVIDMTNSFCGEHPEPILESIRTWRTSCGQDAWDAIPYISRVVSAARARSVPVIYSAGSQAPSALVHSGRWADKNRRRGEDSSAGREAGRQIVAPLAPHDGDIVIRKTKPSVFFGTPLLSYLIDLGVDSLICCGTTTSGCVRSTVVDAFSYNYRVSVVLEGTFDRTQASHAMNLFDMEQKYADVVSAQDVVDHLAHRSSGEVADDGAVPVDL